MQHLKRVVPKDKNTAIDPEPGPPCPRCKGPMQVRRHRVVRERELRRPKYFAFWYFCMNEACGTNTVTSPEGIVINPKREIVSVGGISRQWPEHEEVA